MAYELSIEYENDVEEQAHDDIRRAVGYARQALRSPYDTIRITEDGETIWLQTHDMSVYNEQIDLMRKIAEDAGLKHVVLSSDRIGGAHDLKKTVAGQGVDRVLVRDRSLGDDIVVVGSEGVPTLLDVLRAIDGRPSIAHTDHIFFEGYTPSGGHDPKKGKLLVLNVFMGS